MGAFSRHYGALCVAADTYVMVSWSLSLLVGAEPILAQTVTPRPLSQHTLYIID